MDKNYIHYGVWYEITYPFPNFNGGAIEIYEWMSNFIPCFTGLLGMWLLIYAPVCDEITHPFINLNGCTI